MIGTGHSPRLEEDAEFEHSLVEAILEASPDGVLVVDDHGVIVSHNRRLLELFDIDARAVPGACDGDLTGVAEPDVLTQALDRIRDPDAFIQRVRALYADPSLEDVCEVALNSGQTLERHSRALWNAAGRYLGRVWFFRDITERKEAELALERISRRDPLTGVANRRHFFDRTAEEFARARRSGTDLSLIMLDVDRFKRINDRWGHAAGDRVIQDLCEGARTVLRASDLFARLGGEEFAVLAPETDLAGAFELAERLRQHIAGRALEEAGDIIRYTISAGVGTLMPDDASTESALLRADRALFDAKRSGRDRTVCQPAVPHP